MTNKKLPEGTWRVIAYLSEGNWVDATTDPAPEMTIEADAVYGTSGLNRFKAGPPSLPLGPIATTLMAGPPDLMDQEHKLLAQMQEADDVVAGTKGMFLMREGLAVVELIHRGTDSSSSDV